LTAHLPAAANAVAGLEVLRDWLSATANFASLPGLLGPACRCLGALLDGALVQKVSGCSKARCLVLPTLTR